MSISLKDPVPISTNSHAIMQIRSCSSATFYLDFNGTIWSRRNEPNSIVTKVIDGENDANKITVFDLSTNLKTVSDLLIAGYESGSIEFFNLTGTSQKKLKDSHKGAITVLRFSPDFQTILSCSEDKVLKLWSRAGMLRSELAKADSIPYALDWSPNGNQLVYSDSKKIWFKNIRPGTPDVSVKVNDAGVITVLSWSANENIILAAGEEGRFHLIDANGNLISSSAAFDSAFCDGKWSSLSPFFILATYEEIFMGDKSGRILSRCKISTPAFSMNFLHGSNRAEIGLDDGKVQCAALLLFASRRYKNYQFQTQQENHILVSDIHSEYKEVLDFSDSEVNHFSIAHDKMLILTQKKAHLYDTSNFITPTLFDLPGESLLFSQITPSAVVLAFAAAQTECFVFDFSGKQTATFKLQCQLLSAKQFCLSRESACFIDPANPRVIQFVDSGTGKPFSTVTHSNDVSYLSLNSLQNSQERKLMFLDANKDLFVHFLNKNVTKKIASLVNSFCWHEKLDFLAFCSSQKISICYHPSSLLFDSKLFSLVTKGEALATTSEIVEFTDQSLCTKNERELFCEHGVDFCSVKMAKLFSEKKNATDTFEQAVKLARFLKKENVWALLAVFSLDKRDTNTAEICLASLEKIDKAQFFAKVNAIEEKDMAQCELLKTSGKFEDCEKILLGKKKDFAAVKMYAKVFEFRKALELAKTCKASDRNKDWFVDYVLWKRKNYLADSGIGTETDEAFKGTEPRMSYEDLKPIKRKQKAV